TGEKMTLDFQGADINSVFRLISEISGFSIVAGPDVKADVTAHMKNVPWDQALDTILEVNGLGKKQSGKVITVLPLEELKKAEEAQKKKDVTQGRLRQISIEAKIVEVNTTFARELGIRWGGGYKAGSFAMGIGSASSGLVTPIPGGGIGFTNSNVAVNFPSALAAAPAIGLLLGTSKMILDAKLSALESTGDGKIISSPKVTTLDGEKATIEQGEQIPLTTLDDNGNPVVSGFKDALLSLEVTPTLTPAGRISLKVKASNDYADWETGADGLRVANPPINTSSVDSTVVVRDGGTIVVGGVYKTITNETMSGVPWLSKIPVLGWLFKYKTVSNDKRELLIFVTPKIVMEEE
ncbi:MAG: secretin and TonB N-terminal domain-containing protein, partial [Deltaproteobacteria bacterium]|nr:secretin and TonB N-terminal domain-containing protein [Deltaproteobacteria bacterium]